MTKNFKRKQYAKAVLTNLHALRQRRYVGDLDASDTLIDFERAVEMAQLTARQAEALRLHYDNGLKQKDAATVMGVGQPNVKAYIDAATEKIDDIYEYWAWLSGELIPEDFVEE